jgi:ribosomal protein S18 acetylase RimI-like enzyme
MGVSSRQPASAFLQAWEFLGDVVDGASMRIDGQAAVGMTGLPVPTLNGVWATSAEISSERLRALIDEVDPGVPHCVQLPVDAPGELAQVLTEYGLTRSADVPLMALEDLQRSDETDLVVRVLAPAEVGLHAAVAAAGFGAPEAIFQQLVTPRMAASPGVTVAVGEVAGEPVTTGLAITIAGCSGVFNIATPEEHRGRGYGAAVTRWLADRALTSRARLVWLQSSPSGFGIYQRLGFRTVDTWQCWISGQPS